MSKLTQSPTDIDHPWKLIFTVFFQEGIRFIQPALHEQIDWTKDVEFLEQELHEAIKTRFHSAKICDKLAKVYLKNGDSVVLLIHIEVESAPRADFGKRVFWYRILIFDKHKTERIYSMVVYTGPKSKNQVSKYEYNYLENRVLLEFPIVKVWELDEDLLKQSDNIFAVFLLAQKYANESKKDMDKRFAFRKFLFELAFERKISEIKIIQCLIFVRYLTALPTDLEIKFKDFKMKRIDYNSPAYWLTFEALKDWDDVLDHLKGVSLGRLVREAEAKAKKAEEDAKKAIMAAQIEAAKTAKAAKETAAKAAKAAEAASKAAAKAAAEAAAKAEKEAEKKAKKMAAEAKEMEKVNIVIKSFFDLKMDIKTIALLVGFTQKKIKGIVAIEEQKRNKNQSN